MEEGDMAVLVDSDMVPEEERVSYWSSELARTFFPPVVQPADRGPFQRRMLANSLGQIRVFQLSGTPSVMAHTAATIPAADSEFLSLMIQLRGCCRQTQSGRRSRIVPGEAVSHDSSRPYLLSFPDPFEILVFAVPKTLLRPHADRVCKKTGLPISAESGVASIAVPFLRQVAAALADGTICENDVNISESVLHLIKALHLENPPRRMPTQPPMTPEQTMACIRSSIEERLGDPELSPEMIADLSYISTSYLHKLFRKHEGMSMGNWVRKARLGRCRRDLLDPSLADRTVMEIASGWGFPSASHFSRAFRAEFGCSPRELRRADVWPQAPAVSMSPDC